jgi:hypothetical protein
MFRKRRNPGNYSINPTKGSWQIQNKRGRLILNRGAWRNSFPAMFKIELAARCQSRSIDFKKDTDFNCGSMIMKIY